MTVNSVDGGRLSRRHSRSSSRPTRATRTAQNDPDPLAHAGVEREPRERDEPEPARLFTPGQRQLPERAAVPGEQAGRSRPPHPSQAAPTFIVTIDYTGRPGVYNDGDGTTEGWFRSNTPAAPNDGAFVTTEPVGTMAWMPLNNHPSAKPTVDVYDTVNAGKTAISAGELVSTNPQANPPDANFPGGSVTWHLALAGADRQLPVDEQHRELTT